MKKTIIAVALALSGCAMFSAAVGPTLAFADCVWSVYQAEPQGTPMVNVVADVAKTCGGDVPAIVNVLNTKESPALHGSAGAHQLPR